MGPRHRGDKRGRVRRVRTDDRARDSTTCGGAAPRRGCSARLLGAAHTRDDVEPVVPRRVSAASGRGCVPGPRLAWPTARARLELGGPPIRFLLHFFLALLLAVTIALAGYAIVLGSGHAPPVPADPVRIEPPPALPEPERLPRRPSFVPASAEQPDTRLQAEPAPLELEVRGLDAGLLQSAGVGVFDAELDLLLEWLPLRVAAAGETGLRLRTSAPGLPLRVVVARDQAAALHGYWLQTTLAPDRDPDALVVLDAPVQQVHVQVVTEPPGHGQVMRLRRLDDPLWQPVAAYQGEFARAVDGALDLLLGPGRYELEPWSEPRWQPVVLEVPGPAEVTARYER